MVYLFRAEMGHPSVSLSLSSRCSRVKWFVLTADLSRNPIIQFITWWANWIFEKCFNKFISSRAVVVVVVDDDVVVVVVVVVDDDVLSLSLSLSLVVLVGDCCHKSGCMFWSWYFYYFKFIWRSVDVEFVVIYSDVVTVLVAACELVVVVKVGIDVAADSVVDA